MWKLWPHVGLALEAAREPGSWAGVVVEFLCPLCHLENLSGQHWR